MQFKRLSWLLRDLKSDSVQDNLHRIAISNLSDPQRRTERWWKKKYGQPLKPYHEHTYEELLIEMLEDYYDLHPAEIDRFEANEEARLGTGWDGTMSEDYEREMQKKLKRINEKNGVNLSKYQTDVQLSEEDERKILESLGRDLPGSRVVTKRGNAEPVIETLGAEFDESF